MLNFSFRNRIAFNYIISTALLIFVVFFAIFTIVKYSVYSHINSDIKSEVDKHLTEIEIKGDHIGLNHDDEWKEREHNTVAVNPVFVQFYDAKGNINEKSPNLKIHNLHFYKNRHDHELFDTKFVKKTVRQIQVPIYHQSEKKGYLVVAMSLEDAQMVLHNLSKTLLIAYPLILVVLFLIARLIAGRSIKPVTSIIDTAGRITKDNLKSRIELPENKDELHKLSQTINHLLDRIENTIEREKQFTSDASHELRTPLAIIKGTLEVLIRKPREKQEYEEKINFCISEVNRVNHLVDQLLLLARFENQKKNIQNESVHLNSLLLDNIARFSDKIKSKNIQVETKLNEDFYIKSDSYLVSIILSNIISNAIKYSKENGTINISLSNENGAINCCISDTGIGIIPEDLNKIFNSFYRSEATNHPEIKGTGLGLSIVKRLCDLLTIGVTIESKENSGTSVFLSFH